MITARQCRMARAALGWTTQELADRAGVGFATVSRFERDVRMPIRSVITAIQRAFEAAGVEFIPGGARLRSDIEPGEEDPSRGRSVGRQALDISDAVAA